MLWLYIRVPPYIDVQRRLCNKVKLSDYGPCDWPVALQRPWLDGRTDMAPEPRGAVVRQASFASA